MAPGLSNVTSTDFAGLPSDFPSWRSANPFDVEVALVSRVQWQRQAGCGHANVMVPGIAVDEANFCTRRYHRHSRDELHFFLVDHRQHGRRIFSSRLDCRQHDDDSVRRGFAIFVNNRHLQAAGLSADSSKAPCTPDGSAQPAASCQTQARRTRVRRTSNGVCRRLRHGRWIFCLDRQVSTQGVCHIFFTSQ